MVEHSHDYSNAELYRRHFGDAAALASIRSEAPHTSPLQGFLLPLAKRCVRDTFRLARMGRLARILA